MAVASLPNFNRYRDKVTVPKGQVLKYKANQGYYTAPAPLKTNVVKKGTTTQNDLTPLIETPAQIETRVRRMADETYARQKKDLADEAASMRKEAEGRQAALQAAYQSAAGFNSGRAGNVQAGWNTAAATIQGLAGGVTGGIGDALAADLALQEQALSRVGAAGTGFDARSQAAVEAYRGGTLPAEYMARMGGIANESVNQGAISLANRGLQEGLAGYRTDVGKVDADMLKQVRALTEGRSDYESKLRDSLLGARSDQIKELQDQREFNASLSLKQVQVEQAQQKIDLQYQEAKLKAVTTADKFALDQWYKQQNVILSQARNDIATQRVGIAQQNADTATTRATTAAETAKGGGTPATKRMAIKNAQDLGSKAASAAIKAIAQKTPNINPPADWDEDEDGKWTADPRYISARKEAQLRASLNFGSIMYRTINVIGPYLKEIGYTPTQIKRMAYNIVSPNVDAPRSWLQKNPGFGPKL